MSYEAIVTKVHTFKHPNADKIQLGTCHGYQVVVGLDTMNGELGVFFPADGQLSDDFCRSNYLYSESACKKLDYTPEPRQNAQNRAQGSLYGFFSERRRVRAQSFRGQRSEGFWVPLGYLAYTGVDTGSLKEGETFTNLNGVEICCKYETPATQRNASNKIGRKQHENKCFPKHDVTRQFKYVGKNIPSDAVIYITEKLHGTSGRYGLVLDETPLRQWQLALNRVLPRRWRIFPSREYKYLNGSKNVILEKTTGAGYYGTNEFRYRAIENVTLHKGEVLYFEIVGDVITRGWDSAGIGGQPQYRPIMEPQPIKEEMAGLRKQYGEVMRYRYGLADGQLDIYVYKIVRMNEDGVGTDLSWPQVKQRCAELGLKHVPELAGPFSLEVTHPDHYDDGVEYDTPITYLYNLDLAVERLTEGSSTLDSSHIREGIVLRVESSLGIDYVKNKSYTFGVLEGYIKDDDNYVDTEEVA